jgi:hypothetical protein
MATINKAQLRNLIKKWDRKLKDSGFDDIENRKTEMLRHNGGDIVVSNALELFEEQLVQRKDGEQRGYSSIAWKNSQAEYFRLAAQVLHTFDFKEVFHRIVWQLHSEGFSLDEITQILRSQRHQIRKIVEKTAKEVGLKPFDGRRFEK